jgi:flagellar hook-length control protein FliK
MEHSEKGTRKEEGNDRLTSLPGRNGMAMDTVIAGKLEQGNLYAGSGPITDTKTAGASSLRPEALIEQVAVHTRQGLLNGPGRMKITLNPPHLGTINMDVLVRNNKVEVVMIASNQEVQQVLKSHADQLKNALQGQGLKVDGFDVMLSGNQGERGYRFSSGNFSNNGSGGGSGSREEIEARHSLPDILSPQEMRGDGNNGNGISLFV